MLIKFILAALFIIGMSLDPEDDFPNDNNGWF